MQFETMSQLGDTIKGIIEISNGQVKVIDPKRVRGALIDRLVYTAVFHEKPDMRGTARWIIKMAAPQLGVYLASIQPLYEAMGRGEAGGFTVPAINVRGMAYDTARAIFRSVGKNNVGTFILEIAKSEMGYTHQSPAEYAAVMAAAAIQEGYQGPLFIQGDHIQLNAKKFKENRQKEVDGVRKLMKEAIAAGFFNIDIDSSTLVDLDPPDVVEQQRDNFEVGADLTAYVRSLEPKGVTISVGGEIGEVGGKNSTVEEFKVYIDHYLTTLEKLRPGAKGISKISVQTGTSHGGVPMPDGTVAKVKLDFGVLESISKVAREEYRLAGAVQHGASTLPPEVFDRFPKTGTAEIHLATEFQNMIYEQLPNDFKQEIYAYLREACQDEMKAGQTDEQFIYKTRKKALGPFKKRLWDLPADLRRQIGQVLEDKFTFLFNKLDVIRTRETVLKWVKPVEVSFAIREEIAAAEVESKAAAQPKQKEEVNPLAD
ncbi:MAG: class II fructose-bisphosphate aldolase [Nitrospirae bacterium]|nr:class II fructose-bisphosphate aldolase [Candidatus Manganitrophaceae bacterium]